MSRVWVGVIVIVRHPCQPFRCQNGRCWYKSTKSRHGVTLIYRKYGSEPNHEVGLGLKGNGKKEVLELFVVFLLRSLFSAVLLFFRLRFGRLMIHFNQLEWTFYVCANKFGTLLSLCVLRWLLFVFHHHVTIVGFICFFFIVAFVFTIYLNTLKNLFKMSSPLSTSEAILDIAVDKTKLGHLMKSLGCFIYTACFRL